MEKLKLNKNLWNQFINYYKKLKITSYFFNKLKQLTK